MTTQRARVRRFTPAQRARAAAFVPHPTVHRRAVVPEPKAPGSDAWEDTVRVRRMRMLAGGMVAAELAARRAEGEQEARMRVLRIGLAHERDEVGEADRGTTGEAMKQRGAQVETVEADVETESGEREYQRVSVAVVRDGVMDHYVRAGVLVGRRLDAMEQFAGYYTAARIAPGTSRSGGPRGHGEMSEDQTDAWGRWCKASDHVDRRCRETVEDVARGRFPCRHNAVCELRQGAADLADFFGMRADRNG